MKHASPPNYLVQLATIALRFFFTSLRRVSGALNLAVGFNPLSLPELVREMRVSILARECGRQSKAWGEAR